MSLNTTTKVANLVQQIEDRVRVSTHGRIRNLTVVENQGCYTVGGQVPSHYTKQLALHGALELLAGDRFASAITVRGAIDLCNMRTLPVSLRTVELEPVG